MTKPAYLRGSGGRGLGHEIGMMSDKMAGRLHGQCYTELDRQSQRRNGDSVITSGCSRCLGMAEAVAQLGKNVSRLVTYLAFRVLLDL